MIKYNQMISIKYHYYFKPTFRKSIAFFQLSIDIYKRKIESLNSFCNITLIHNLFCMSEPFYYPPHFLTFSYISSEIFSDNCWFHFFHFIFFLLMFFNVYIFFIVVSVSSQYFVFTRRLEIFGLTCWELSHLLDCLYTL